MLEKTLYMHSAKNDTPLVTVAFFIFVNRALPNKKAILSFSQLTSHTLTKR